MWGNGDGMGFVLPFVEHDNCAGQQRSETKKTDGMSLSIGKFNAYHKAFAGGCRDDFGGENVFNHARRLFPEFWATRRSRAGPSVLHFP